MLRRQSPLIGVAIGEDRADRAHIPLNHDAARNTASGGHFLDHQNGVEIGSAQSAFGFWRRHAHEARLGQRLDHGPGVVFRPVGIRSLRSYDFRRQRAGAHLQVSLIVREAKGRAARACRVIHGQYSRFREADFTTFAILVKARCFYILHDIT